MNARRYVWFVVWLLTLAVGIGVGTVIGQPSPPTENKGVDAKVVSTVDLAPDMPGYQLRLRNVVFEPGPPGANAGKFTVASLAEN